MMANTSDVLGMPYIRHVGVGTGELLRGLGNLKAVALIYLQVDIPFVVYQLLHISIHWRAGDGQ
jgi:hypothetical protein